MSAESVTPDVARLVDDAVRRRHAEAASEVAYLSGLVAEFDDPEDVAALVRANRELATLAAIAARRGIDLKKTNGW